jgi:glycosidase
LTQEGSKVTVMTADRLSALAGAVIYELPVRNYSQEGTLAKVTEDLARIRGLGVDILYLMPIHPISKVGRKGNDGSLYAIADYRAVRPELGDKNDLKHLIDRAHELGMRVVMDVVYNHTGRDSVLLRTHPEWFLHDSDGNPTLKFEDWWDIYDLDFSKRELWDELIDTLHQWVGLGADGFRCDVAAMVPLEFWLAARRSFDGDKDLVWIAESVYPGFIALLRSRGFVAHSDTELYPAFDITYDFDGRECLERYWRGQADLSEYLHYLYVQANLYPRQAIKMRFLENHDFPRIAQTITSPSSLRNWTAFYMLLPGASMVSAGQEAAVSTQASLFDQEPIPWSTGDPDFTRFFSKALAVAKEIKRGSTGFAADELAKGLARITWSGGAGSYAAILNLEDRHGEIELAEPIVGQELLTDKPVSIERRYAIQKEPLIIREADAHSPLSRSPSR